MRRRVHLYDPELKKEYVGDLSKEELPKVPWLVGQWCGAKPVSVPNGSSGVAIKHFTTLITPRADVAVFTLDPFNVRPLVAGYYLVHHQRRDKIYSANVGGYECTLFINDTLVTGVDADEVNDSDIARAYADADRATLNLSAIVYCDGDTSEIELMLKHSHSGTRDFSSILADNGRAHTSIWYLGERVPISLSGEALGAGSADAMLAGSEPVLLTGSAAGSATTSGSLML